MSRLTLSIWITALFLFAVIACGSSPDDAPATGYPITPSDSLIEIGKPLYEGNCASCHGDANTPPQLPFIPTHGDIGHTWHHPDRILVDWILNGTPSDSVMPAFRAKFSEPEARAVVGYIKTFWSNEILDRQLGASELYEEWLASREVSND